MPVRLPVFDAGGNNFQECASFLFVNICAPIEY